MQKLETCARGPCCAKLLAMAANVSVKHYLSCAITCSVQCFSERLRFEIHAQNVPLDREM